MLQVLNLYAGLGGNRKHWDANVTAVEIDPKIAAVYQQQHPNDNVVVADAHQYLLDHFEDYDFIWTSPPCQSHTRMLRGGRNRKPRYAVMDLYQQIIFLNNTYKGKWVVENVVPYYDPLISPTKKIGRHLFWANFLFDCKEVAQPKGFINMGNVAGAEKLKEWLGIDYTGNLYYGKGHDPAQVLRNCVHPELGKQIFEQYKAAPFQPPLWESENAT